MGTSMVEANIPVSTATGEHATAKLGTGVGQTEPSTDKSWYVVCCKARQEHVACQNLLRQNFEVYYPQLASRQHTRGRWKTSVQPLFPRYLFVRADRQRQSLAAVRSTYGALGLVRFGTEPAVISDAMVRTIAARADATTGLHTEDIELIDVGSKVRVLEGPFAGIDALCAGRDGEVRTLLLIELLGKTNTVSVPRQCVSRVA